MNIYSIQNIKELNEINNRELQRPPNGNIIVDLFGISLYDINSDPVNLLFMFL